MDKCRQRGKVYTHKQMFCIRYWGYTAKLALVSGCSVDPNQGTRDWGRRRKKRRLQPKREKGIIKKKQGGILVVHIHIWSNCKRVCQCRPIGWPMNESGITPTKIPNHLSSLSRKWKNIVWTKENQLKRLNLFFPEGHPVQCATFRYYIYF